MGGQTLNSGKGTTSLSEMHSLEGLYLGTWSSSRTEGTRLFPLREVPMGGMRGGIGFVNAPLTALEVRSFKKEIRPLMEDPVGVSQQLDQFLGARVYTWEEINSILTMLFSSEEVQMIRVAEVKIWERENRLGPPGEHKLPLVDPNWDPNDETGRQNVKEYQNLIVRGIEESVCRTNNIKLAFGCHQGKEESPVDWLNRLKRNFQLYFGLDPESLQGQAVL